LPDAKRNASGRRQAGRKAEMTEELPPESRVSDDLLAHSRALAKGGRLAAALDAVAEAREMAPTRLDILGWQALLLRLAGRADEALPLLRIITEKDPGTLDGWAQLILTQQSDPDVSLADLAATAAAAWTHAPSVTPEPMAADGRADKVLRIAYVSGDFKEHPVAYFLDGVVDSHDRTQFEVHLISTAATSDARTASLKDKDISWHDICALSDEDAAELLRGLGIDIAVDLSGWTAGHRLGVFRRRIAPVQLTWIGYSGTTGLKEMDYIVCDAEVLPPEHEPYYSERPLRLAKTYLCQSSPVDWLPKELTSPPRPDPKAHRIVFGSFNNLAKITEGVIDTWCEILKRVDGSLLVMRARMLTDRDIAQTLGQRFIKRGIEPNRLILEGNETRKGMLGSYRKIDIALDPFPYGGTTTTFEALAMGVPVITLQGARWTARVGASFLSAVGLTDLISDTPETYIEVAVKLAQDLPRLKALRSNLAAQTASSPMCDIVGFTRDFEARIRAIWQEGALGSD